ncbi:MAG: hypothetical protein IPL03_17925 [Sterolibacteriaceae bacterium]|nr:hypothetical protein [Candidatus Methylophosphatis haderslevensis]
MLGLGVERLAIEVGGLGHVAQQRQVGDVARGLGLVALRLVGKPDLGLVFALEGVLGCQRVATREFGERIGQAGPLAGRGAGEPGREVVNRAAQVLDLLGVVLARLLEFGNALPRGGDVMQQRVEIRPDRQPRGRSNLGDQAADVVFPAALADRAGVPVEQRPQFGRQVGKRRDGRAFHQRGHQRDVRARQRADQFVAHHVVRVVQARQVVGVGPARADHRHAGCALRQRAVDRLAPLADADARHVAEHLLAAEADAQPVVDAPAGAARVVAAVADENAVALRG